MQWHPLFVHLLRPLVESHFEVRTDQPVGDLPRQADVVLLHKATAGPTPFKGLWRWATTWNALEYKGPTVSPRIDALHDLIELGLGIHRRLNELQIKQQQPVVDFAEVSFWYLVHHLGRRFLAELPAYLPDVRQVAQGIWQAHVFAHPVLLVSVQELAVERDSLALRVLAGVPEQERKTVLDLLREEPALWSTYGAWLSYHEPAIWQEIERMAAEQNETITVDFKPLAEYLVRSGDRVGIKTLLEGLGIQRAVEAVGEEQLWANLSPQQRENLRRLIEQDKPTTPEPTE